MKNTEVCYLNEEHEIIVQKHLIKIKEVMYFATENVREGKYQDFLTILNSVFMYSNNFHESMVDKRKDDGLLEEFLFLIPNMVFYTTIGFLTGLKDGKNDFIMSSSLDKIGSYCELITSELADILIDEKEKERLNKDFLNLRVGKN